MSKKLFSFRNLAYLFSVVLLIAFVWSCNTSTLPGTASNGECCSDGEGDFNGETKQDDLLSLFEQFSINHTFVLVRSFAQGIDTTYVRANSLSMRGNIQLTDNWRINVGNIGYDFKSKRLTYPDIGFYRDLHCWEMGMNWQPQRGTYSFYIRVKPSSLDFINIPYRRNNADGFGGF